MASTLRWQRSTTSIRFLATVASDGDHVHVDAELPRHHASGIADALDAVQRVADRQRMQHGAALAGGVAHAGGGDAGNVGRGDRAALDVGRGFDQLTLQPAARYREQHGLDPDLGHAFGQRHRLAHRLLAFGEIDHRAGLDAARLDLAVADQFDGMAAAAQGVVRRARLQPRDHAGDLAGADIERRHQRGALLRHRSRLRRLIAIEAGHASPAFFFGFLSLNRSSRALAASSDNCTVSRSGRRMSMATMSRENSRSSLSSFDKRRQRVADVVFRQPDIETILEAQVPAPLADENRGLGEVLHLRIAREQREEIPCMAFRRPCRPPAAATMNRRDR